MQFLWFFLDQVVEEELSPSEEDAADSGQAHVGGFRTHEWMMGDQIESTEEFIGQDCGG
jgi:hypothetical protein